MTDLKTMPTTKKCRLIKEAVEESAKDMQRMLEPKTFEEHMAEQITNGYLNIAGIRIAPDAKDKALKAMLSDLRECIISQQKQIDELKAELKAHCKILDVIQIVNQEFGKALKSGELKNCIGKETEP